VGGEAGRRWPVGGRRGRVPHAALSGPQPVCGQGAVPPWGGRRA